MRRGFKKHARSLALEVRGEIGLTAHEVFQPRDLATLYGIPIVRFSDIEPSVGEPRDGLQVSGAVIPLGTGTVILENDHHASTRLRLTLSHEMAHVVLEHRHPPTWVDDKGCRQMPEDQEDEANEVAGELVLPFDAALALAWRDASDMDAARRFEISEAAARWRMNATGVRLIVDRTRRSRGRQGK